MNSPSNKKIYNILDAEAYDPLKLQDQAIKARRLSELHVTIENSFQLSSSLLTVCDRGSLESVASTTLPTWKEKKAKHIIASNLSEHVSVAEIAKECALSRSHFSRAFKHTTGLSPKEWLTTSRILKSQQLLLDGCLPIAQIGVECGFTDQSHFTRVFSKCVGIPPGKWPRIKLSFRGGFTDAHLWTSGKLAKLPISEANLL